MPGGRGQEEAPLLVGPEDMVVGPARVEKAHHDGRARDGLLVGPLDDPRHRAGLRGGLFRLREWPSACSAVLGFLPDFDGADAKGRGSQTRTQEEGRRSEQSSMREWADRARHVNLQETLNAGRNRGPVGMRRGPPPGGGSSRP